MKTKKLIFCWANKITPIFTFRVVIGSTYRVYLQGLLTGSTYRVYLQGLLTEFTYRVYLQGLLTYLFVYFNLYKCTSWTGVLGVARGIIFFFEKKHIFENTCREFKTKIQTIRSCRLASYSYNIHININIYWFTKYKYLSARALSYTKIYISCFFSIECCAVILFYYVNVDMHMVLIRSIGSVQLTTVQLTKQSSLLQSSLLNSPDH